MIFYPLMLILALIVNVFFIAAVHSLRRSEPISNSFILYIGWTSAWLFLEFILQIPISRGHELVICKILAVFWITVGFVFLNFIYRLLLRPHDKIFAFLGAISLAGALLAVSTNLVEAGYMRSLGGVGDIRGPLYTLVATIPFVCCCFSMWLIWQAARRAANPEQRSIYRLILIGGLITIGLITTLNLIVPSYADLPRVFNIGSPAMPLFWIFVYRAAKRYRFLVFTVGQVGEEIFNNTGDGLVVTDPAGFITKANKACAKILDTEDRDITGRPIGDFIVDGPPDENVRVREVELVGNQARRQVVLSQAFLGHANMKVGKVILLQDVTDQRQMEARLRKRNEVLEQQVEEHSDELRQAQKMEAIGILAEGIAHDFNNILAAILGFSTAAREDTSDDSMLANDMDEVLMATRRARDIVQQLLTFSGRSDRVGVDLDVASSVREALGLLKVSLPKEIEIVCNTEADEAFVHGDPTQINQVIMNLATNAYHSMGSKGGRLTIFLGKEDLDQDFVALMPPLSAGEHVIIEVQDTGCGMDAETQRRIFEPFFTTKASGEGTGLGLSGVLKIVKDIGGAITVNSRLGDGTSFRVYLPSVKQVAVRQGENLESISAGSERILIVDDEEQLIRMYKRLLEPAGYQLTCLSNSFEAWIAFRDSPNDFDLVITDQTMPEMKGTELATEILGIRPEIPIMLISGYADAVSPVVAKEIGIARFLSKPVSKAELAESIRRLLDKPAPGKEPR
jgi:signal transduction histidine kinase/ActR/RegA family two-component response regulator